MMDDTEKNRIWQKITEYAEASASELSELRRDFHRHPEPGWMEFRTSGRIADLLHLYGCDEVLTDQQVCKAEARMGGTGRRWHDRCDRYAALWNGSHGSVAI